MWMVQAQGQTIGQSQINIAGTVGSNQTIVSGSSALSLTGSTGTIQWQSSTDNVTFANISELHHLVILQEQ